MFLESLDDFGNIFVYFFFNNDSQKEDDSALLRTPKCVHDAATNGLPSAL